VIHSVKDFSVISEVEVDVFLEFFCFFYDPVDVGNLISGSSDFPKHSLYIWKFLKRCKYQTTLAAYWETCMQVKKQQLEPDMK